jgi:hypothetical protein
MEIITNYIILLIPYLGIEENKAKLKTTLINLESETGDLLRIFTVGPNFRYHQYHNFSAVCSKRMLSKSCPTANRFRRSNYENPLLYGTS